MITCKYLIMFVSLKNKLLIEENKKIKNFLSLNK